MEKIIYTKKSIKKIALAIFLFFVLFNPPIIPGFSIRQGILVLSAIYILINYPRMKALMNKSYFKYFKIWLIFIVYTLFIIGINALLKAELWAEHKQSIFTIINFVLYSNITSIFVILYANKHKLSYKDIIDSIITAGTIEGILVLVSIISPAIKNSFLTIMSKNLKNINEKISTYLLDPSSKRNFGFADNLYDMFGFTVSIIYVASLHKTIQKSTITNWAKTILLLIATVINTRTGIILSIVGTIIIITHTIKGNNKQNQLLKRIIALAAMSLLAVIIALFIKNNMPNTYKWIASGYNSTVNYIQGNEASDYYSQAKDFWFLPTDAVQQIFGTGASPKKQINKSSDVGYINEIWRYGIVGLILCLSLFISMYMKAKKNNKEWGVLILFALISIMIYMIKLDAIRECPGTILIVLLMTGYDGVEMKHKELK